MPSTELALGPDEMVETVRVFEAPRALVFRLWAEPRHRVRWWGPEGYGLKDCAVDFRVGGAWSITMQRVDGYLHRVSGEFVEIEEPSRLVFTYVNEQDQHRTLVEIDFVDLGSQTRMHFRQAAFDDVGTRDAHEWGWRSSLGLLADYVRAVMAAGGVPVGSPRVDGVAADMAAARARYEAEGDASLRPSKHDLEEIAHAAGR
jgi:uncharacterized protein YndB with AHSA1/START domain